MFEGTLCTGPFGMLAFGPEIRGIERAHTDVGRTSRVS